MSEKTSTPATKRRKFKALVKIMYGPQNIPVMAGEVTDDLPPQSVGWLLDQGHIVPVTEEAE